MTGAGATATPPGVDDLVAAGPDPGSAAPRLQRFVEAGGVVPADADGQRLLATVFGSGSYLSDLVLTDVEEFTRLSADPALRSEKNAEQIAREVDAAVGDARDLPALQRGLRRYARREMLRLGARQLGWGTTMEVARELSHLADGCLQSSLRVCRGILRDAYDEPLGDHEIPSFVVLAMGKMGGLELNFSSDIDLIYFYSTDDGRAGTLTLHEYFSRLAQLLTQSISEPTDDGFVFRVDLRLRPEGRSGAICNSVAAAERYYETFGRTWERQALLRARPAAGDRALGDRLLKTLEPFVFPRSLSRQAVDDVLSLRGRFARTVSDDAAINVKLSPGGIRDVELCAQLLQLVHGGQRRELRVRGTLPALNHLALAGLLSDRERRGLTDAYEFLRTLEHLIQLEQGAQTHSLPDDDWAVGRLARRMGFAGPAAGAEFLAKLAAHRKEVLANSARFALPEDPGADGPDGGPREEAPPLVLRLLDPSRDDAGIDEDLRAAGFADLDAARAALVLAQARMPPAWMTEVIASPDPDRALAHLRDLALGGSAGLFLLLRQHPRLVRVLANLFGTSDRLSRYLLGNPNAWEELLAGLPHPRPEPERLAAELPPRLAGLDEESSMREMRRWKTEHLLRIGLHDVSGTLEPEEVSLQLVTIAETCLRACVAQVSATLGARFGIPDTTLTILALGSLGAREMRYGSDLDLVFLFAGNGTTSKGLEHQEWFGKLAQRLISSLGARLDEGRLYEVDARLRPSGAQGLLVTSYEAFAAYHQQQAAPWEHAALLRARPLLSLNLADATIDTSFAAILAGIAYGHRLDPEILRAELHRIRARVENERAGHDLHLRLSPGGLTDGEFIAAFGQLMHGPADARLQTTSPYEALHALAHGAAPPGSRYARAGIDDTFLADYRFLRRAGLRLRLMREGNDERLRPSDQRPLARTLDLGESTLTEKLTTAMTRVRAGYDRIFS